jgi:hypothetical protein
MNADFIIQLKEVIALLNKIERTYASERRKLLANCRIKYGTNLNFKMKNFIFSRILAGDLNFYEPVERDRDAALGYYDDDRLSELTGTALKKIESFLAA